MKITNVSGDDRELVVPPFFDVAVSATDEDGQPITVVADGQTFNVPDVWGCSLLDQAENFAPGDADGEEYVASKEPPPPEPDLSKLKKDELLELATSEGLVVSDAMTKAEIRDVIETHEEGA